MGLPIQTFLIIDKDTKIESLSLKSYRSTRRVKAFKTTSPVLLKRSGMYPTVYEAGTYIYITSSGRLDFMRSEQFETDFEPE